MRVGNLVVIILILIKLEFEYKLRFYTKLLINLYGNKWASEKINIPQSIYSVMRVLGNNNIYGNKCI